MAESLGELLDELQGLRERATPGPWEQHKVGSVFICVRDGSQPRECKTVADAETLGLPRIEAERNAATITAAVNLLQPLIDVARAAGWEDGLEHLMTESIEGEDTTAVTYLSGVKTALDGLRDAILSQNMEGRS